MAADQQVWFVALVSIVIMLLVYAAKSFILHIMFGQIIDELRVHADSNLMIVALSIFSLGIYSAGVAVFRTMGNVRLPITLPCSWG